jgi:hypothetical protein
VDAPDGPVADRVRHPADAVQLSRRYWRGTKYSVIQRCRSGFPSEEFDAPFARLDWTSRNRFDLQRIATPENGSASIAALPSPKRLTC